MQHATHTTNQPTSPSCETGAIQKSLSLNEEHWGIFWGKKSGVWASWQKKKRKKKRTRQKKKIGDSKVESKHSPEIQDREETYGIPGLTSGAATERRRQRERGTKKWRQTHRANNYKLCTQRMQLVFGWFGFWFVFLPLIFIFLSVSVVCYATYTLSNMERHTVKQDATRLLSTTSPPPLPPVPKTASD